MKMLLIVLSTAALLAPVLDAEVYLHPSWSARSKEGWVLAVLPATCEMTVEGAGATRLQRDESQVLEARLAAAVAQALQTKGWTISEDVFHSEDVARNGELFFLVRYLRERNATLTQRITLAPKEMKAGNVSFGKAITEIQPYTKANILVFVHVLGFRLTTAERILRIAVGTYYYGTVGLLFDNDVFRGSQFKIRATFVDAETGDVLCFVKPKHDGPQAFVKELEALTH